jgi:hypothetical protein
MGTVERELGAATLTRRGPVAQLGSAAPWHGEGRGFKSRQVHISAAWPAVLEATGRFLGGLVAGEGCFRWTQRRERFADGSPRLRFVFELSLTAEDRHLLIALQSFLGAGSIDDRGVRRPGWTAESRLTIASEAKHLAATIPFADRFLPTGRKREQFEVWRDRLHVYRRDRPWLLRRRARLPLSTAPGGP